MTPIDMLKKGLNALRKQIDVQKSKIQANLKAKKHITESNKAWLDGEGNPVDEEHVVDFLENVSDYDKGFSNLCKTDKNVVQRLKILAGAITVPVGKKLKRMPSLFCSKLTINFHYSTGPEAKANETTNGKKNVEPVFTKKENATLGQRIKILDWHNANGRNQTKTAKHFNTIYPNLNIKQPLVSSWAKDEAKWQAEFESNSSTFSHTAKRARQMEHPEVTEMLDLWVTKALGDGIILTGEVLPQKWVVFADLVGVPDDERLNLSDGWLASFKARHVLKDLKQHGEAGSADPVSIEREQKRMQELIAATVVDNQSPPIISVIIDLHFLLPELMCTS